MWKKRYLDDGVEKVLGAAILRGTRDEILRYTI